MGFGACKTYDWKYGSRHRTPTVRSLPAPTLGFPGTSYAGTLPQQVGQENRLVHTLNGSGLAVGRTLVAVWKTISRLMVVLKYQKFCVRIERTGIYWLIPNFSESKKRLRRFFCLPLIPNNNYSSLTRNLLSSENLPISLIFKLFDVYNLYSELL